MENNFSVLRSFINEMNSSNSTNHKLDILRKYSTDEFIKNVLFYTYHPYKQYGVTSANLIKRKDLVSDTCKYSNLFDLLDALDSRVITGHLAIASANSFIQQNTEFSDLIYQIIDRNIETRATVTLINRIIPNLIPTFNVALAHDFSKIKGVNITDGTWYSSRKLDGVRCLTVIRDGNVKFFSRNGKEFYTLDIVNNEIEALGLTNCVLDGEICIMKTDGSDDFQGILKEIQRKDHTISLPRYWVFDILTLEEFDSGKGVVSLSERLERFSFSDSVISRLPQFLITSEDQLAEMRVEAKDNSWEGLIARRDVGYEGDRTKNMVKLKEFYDAEYQVADVVMGPQRVIVNEREVEEIMLSAVIIEHKGNPVNVGSGFSLTERREYYNNPHKILGMTVTVQFFEETLDQNGKHSLRFPVFKGNYGQKRSI
jgi:DNA ligase-1